MVEGFLDGLTNVYSDPAGPVLMDGGDQTHLGLV